MAFANGYAYRRSITVDNAKVPNTDQADFPVLVLGTYSYLAHTTHGGLITDLSGFDIAFYADEAGTTPLYWEIESYNHETGAVVFWVKVSLTTAADTVFYVFYGNASVSTFQSTAADVWDAAFLGVYHLGTPSTLSLSGSTSTPRNLTKVNTINAGSGQVSGCGVWPSTGSNYLYAADAAVWDVTNALTLSVWIKTSATGVRLILNRDNGLNRSFQFRLESGKVVFFFFVAAVIKNSGSSSASVGDNAWHHVVATYDGANIRLYIDGSLDASSPDAQTGNINATAEPLLIGCYNDSGKTAPFIGGSIDEPHFSNIVRSADWIAAEFNNQNDPGTFYAVGDQEEPPVAGLAASSAGTSTTVGALQVARALASVSAGTSTAAGTLRTGVKMAAASAGLSTAAGNLMITRALAGLATGTSTAAGGLYVPVRLRGVSQGVSLVNGTLFILIRRRIFSDGPAAGDLRLFGAAPSGTPRIFDNAPAAGSGRIFKP